MNTGINEVWADIDYLIARVEQKTMTREEVVAIVRKKLDTAPREPASAVDPKQATAWCWKNTRNWADAKLSGIPHSDYWHEVEFAYATPPAPPANEPAPAVGGDQYALHGLIHYGRVAAQEVQGATPKHMRNLISQMVPRLQELAELKREYSVFDPRHPDNGGNPPLPHVDAELQRDAERLDWLMLMVSGRELRRIGVDTSGNCTRQDIDTAIQARRQQGDKQ